MKEYKVMMKVNDKWVNGHSPNNPATRTKRTMEEAQSHMFFIQNRWEEYRAEWGRFIWYKTPHPDAFKIVTRDVTEWEDVL